MQCPMILWNMADRGIPSAYGKYRSNIMEGLGQGCRGTKDTCVVVGDTSHKYPGLGTCVQVDKSKVLVHI
jgi:hypothetical protein